MRRERNIAKGLWLASTVTMAILAWLLVEYFTGASPHIGGTPVYSSPITRDASSDDNPVGNPAAYAAIRKYMPKDIVNPPRIQKKRELKEDMQVVKIWMNSNGFNMCKIVPLKTRGSGTGWPKYIYVEGEEVHNGTATIKEIRKDGVLFIRRPGDEEEFLELSTER